MLLDDLSLRMVFPDYLGRTERVVERSRGDFVAAEGTRVTIPGRVARLSRPCDRARQ